MQYKNFHTHTTYCDGKHSIEENILSAISLGMPAIGFSGHSYTDFDLSYCMRKEKIHDYVAEVNYMKEKYRDKINVYCGMELDAFSEIPDEKFDYFIGAAHYIRSGDTYLSVDHCREDSLRHIDEFFGGRIYDYAEAYFESVKLLAKRPEISFIAHFDLVSKFNENNVLFDPENERYKAAWRSAADALLELKVPFEINTGAIARGLRSVPYPAFDIADYIASKNGCFMLSSDCHHKDRLTFAFDEAYEAYKKYNLVDFESLIASRK